MNSKKTTLAGGGALLRNVAAVLLLAGLVPVATAQTTTWPAQYSVTRSSSFEYDTTSGLITKETVEPGSAQDCVQTTYSYDQWGNKQSVQTSNCSGATGSALFESRTATSHFTGDAAALAGAAPGTFPLRTVNALGHEERRKYDARFGVTTSITGPNGLTASVELDAFGRKIVERAADGSSTRYWHCYVGPGIDTASNTDHGAFGTCQQLSATEESALAGMAHARVAYFVHTQAYYRPAGTQTDNKSGPFVRTYYDQRGREIRSVTQAFDAATSPSKGKLIVKDTAYNANGAVVATTQPYFFNSSNAYDRRSTLASGVDYDVAYEVAAGGSKPPYLNPNTVGATYTVYDVLGRPLAIYNVDTASDYSTRSGGSGSASTIPAGAPLGLVGLRASKVSYLYDSQTGLSGQVSQIIDDLGRKRTSEMTPQGKVARTTDATGAQIAFVYDALGNLVKTVDPLNNTVQIGYDLRGRKRWMSDPDKGEWSYDYNALGELKKQTDAKGQSLEIEYDVLGRVTTRSDKSGLDSAYTSRYFYDTVDGTAAGTKCASGTATTKGLLCGTHETKNGIKRSSVYDDFLRPVQEKLEVTVGTAPAFLSRLGYDANTGRVASVTYPTGVQINYTYTALGFLHKVSNAASGAVYWTAQKSNAFGALEQFEYGNSAVNSTLYDPQNPARTLYRGARVGAESVDSVFKHTYRWDSVGNLLDRFDANGNGSSGAVTESFEYDTLNRLTKYDVVSTSIITTNFRRTVELQYNVIGNILYKSDAGAYTYPAAGGARPHAVQSVNGLQYNATFNYDANGNVVAATGSAKYRKLTYTSFNMPDEGVSGGLEGSNGARYRWWYDEDQQRVKEVRTNGSGTRTTWYVHPNNAGGLSFEREHAENGTITNRHYLSAGGATFAVLTSNETGPSTVVDSTVARTITKVEYWHKDHLGSIAATTEQSLAQTRQVRRYAYDPFGKRRYPDGNFDVSGVIVGDYPNGTDRGFTGHEHLDDVGIIHMNGRLFDPLLGRFMQADPMVEDANNLQAFNRYSYVLNNPLNATDPTGYWSLRTHEKWVTAHLLVSTPKTLMMMVHTSPGMKGFERAVLSDPDLYQAGRLICALVTTKLTGWGWGAAVWDAYFAHVSTGKTSEGLKAGGKSLAVAGMFYAAGGVGTDGSWGRIAAHAAAGCASAKVEGGSCRDGALSAGFAEAVGGNVDMDKLDVPARFGIRVVVAGTAAVIGGGKFGNGAWTAAFAYVYNDLTHGATEDALAGTEIHQRVYDEYARTLGAVKDYVGDMGILDGRVDLAVGREIYELKPDTYLKGYKYRSAYGQLGGYVKAAGLGFVRGAATTLGLDGQKSLNLWVYVKNHTYHVRVFYDPSSVNSGLVFYTKALVHTNPKPILVPRLWLLPGGSRDKRLAH